MEQALVSKEPWVGAVVTPARTPFQTGMVIGRMIPELERNEIRLDKTAKIAPVSLQSS